LEKDAMQLTGLHHVTAITARAAQNVTFYTRVLGLRLVKKTVNQDDVSAYHLFYADAIGSPGTDVTFFDWPHTAQNRKGTGSIAAIALRVPSAEALAWWEKWLTSSGVAHEGIVTEDGQAQLRFSDPEGQALALVNDQGAPGGIPWEGSPIPRAYTIRGLYGVTLMVRSLQPTARVLTEVMGFRKIEETIRQENPEQRVAIFESGHGGPGTRVLVEANPSLAPARQGWGGVHHVAFRTPNEKEQSLWRLRLLAAGLHVTPIIDRYYFKSIYFREPGGILFEIATDGPGFAVDEDPEHLGERLALPPFLEPHRAQIEAQLLPLEIGKAG
jgi:glyoxalase family protein